MTKLAAQQAMRAGRLDEARTHLTMLLGTHDDGPELRYNLAMVLVRLGDFVGAAEQFSVCLRAAPDNPELLNNLGNCQRLAGQRIEAEKSLDRALEIAPNHSGVLANRAWLHFAVGEYEQATNRFRSLMDREPDSPDLHRGLAEALSRLSRLEEAHRVLSDAIARFPGHPPLLQAMGALYAKLREPERALDYFSRALEQDPGNPETLLNHGIIAEQLGDTVLAECQFKEALARRPGYPQAHFHLAHLATHKPASSEIEDMQQALAEGASGQDRVDLAFGLGKSLARTGQHDRAFAAFTEARELLADSHPFEFESALKRLALIMAVRHEPKPLKAPKYVFVAGMPRSGTTLVDQVLASHSRLRSLGESGSVGRMLERYRELVGEAYPRRIEQLNPEIAGLLTAELEDALDANAQVCVDTTPTNLPYLGLLSALLPDARFVLCQRDSRDTCVSIYEQPLSSAHAYANRLADLGRYYAANFRLSQHWRGLLGDRLHMVQYERMTTNPAREIEQLLYACGLPMEPQCLEPHLYERAVITPSATQVRQPVNRRSVGRWKHYENHLGLLLEHLPIASFYEP